MTEGEAPELGLEQQRNLFFECKNGIRIARGWRGLLAESGPGGG